MCKMWWSLLALSFTVGAVFASEVTLPLTLQLGNGEINFSEDTDGIYYSIKSQESISPTYVKAGSSIMLDYKYFNFLAGQSATGSSIFLEGSDMARSDRQYSVNNCTADEELCIELVTDGVSMAFRSDLRLSPIPTRTQMNTTLENVRFGTCVHFGDGVQLFGGPEAKYQIWPVQDAVWNYTVYGPKEDDAVAIAEPYWVGSNGVFFYANPETALFIEQNNGTLCMYSENVTPYRLKGYTFFEYWMAALGNPRSAHETVVNTFFPKPTGIPDERMIAQPIWSTWARYKIYVNDSIVRTYANEILNNGFNHSQLEIDDFWETCYGSLTFSTTEDKFPDIKGLTDYLHDLGFRVTLWIHPFINVDCEEYYAIAESNGYFVQNENGSIFTTWWQGDNSSVIDFTNEAAVEWFSSRLTALKESAGIDSFKFDAGEASWAPEPAVLTGPIEQSPGIYTAQFARALAEFGGGIEVRTGWQTQDLPIFVRMLDKDTSWTLQNGLPTLITTLLVMNLAGYGFVLPDMVGGNGYIDGVLVSTEYPSKELFIRWLQANTFMPAIQYSFVPWDYDNETIEICRTYTKLHEEYAPTIIEAMNAAVANGMPVNPPVWWLDPWNTDAYNISDEYLLGEVILVAPVIVEGAVTRNIFLPTGTWRDATYSPHATYEGPLWIYDYPAPLEILPYFVEASYWNSLQGVTETVTDSVTETVTDSVTVTVTENDEDTSFGVVPSSSLIVLCASAILTLVTKLFN